MNHKVNVTFDPIDLKIPVNYIKTEFTILNVKEDEYFDNQTDIPFELIYTKDNEFRFEYKERVIRNINNIINFAYTRFDNITYYQIERFIFQYI